MRAATSSRGPNNVIEAGTRTSPDDRRVDEHAHGQLDRERLTNTLLESGKEMNRLAMISAAQVMTRAVRESPSATASVLSAVLSHASYTRESRKTS